MISARDASASENQLYSFKEIIHSIEIWIIAHGYTGAFTLDRPSQVMSNKPFRNRCIYSYTSTYSGMSIRNPQKMHIIIVGVVGGGGG